MGLNRKRVDLKNEHLEVNERYRKEPLVWKKERLLAIKLLLDGNMTIEQVAKRVGRHRNSINDWIKLFRAGGLTRLLTRGQGRGRIGKMTEKAKIELAEKLKAGVFRTARQAAAWLKEEHGIELKSNSIYYQLGKLKGRLKVPRPCHLKKDAAAEAEFKITLTEKLHKLQLPQEKKVKLWVYDEMRYGLHPVVRRVWSLKGTRVIVPVLRKFEWGYLFGALEVGGGGSEFLYSPTVNKEADGFFLKQLAASDPEAMHVVIGDGAGFHHRDQSAEELPSNLRILTLPAYSPELNPAEKLWDMIKDTICCVAWKSLEAIEEKITRTLREYWEHPQKVLDLFKNSYLTTELNSTWKIISPIQFR
jgi:transposase